MDFINIVKKNVFLPWFICFIFLSLFISNNGGTNEMSRFTTMKAMSEYTTFKINKYDGYTIDWSVKDGNKFSNKAPAPMLLGFPAFYLINFFSKLTLKTSDKHKSGVSKTPRKLTAFFNQVIPLIILCFIIISWMNKSNFSLLSVQFFIMAVFFGNTSSLMMNIYFGHGMAAIFSLAIAFSMIKKNYFYVGLSYGFLLLSEYTAGLIILPLVLSIIYEERKKSDWIRPFVTGGILPFILWCWYHMATTGSIFKIPAMYQNPMWLDHSTVVPKLFGMFAIPKYDIFLKLIFGLERGLLVTQPWILILVLGACYIFKKTRNHQLKALLIFANTSVFVLLIMNSSFNGWHGGSSAGPRYLSMIFPVYGLIGAFYLNEFRAKSNVYLLYIPLIFSLLLYAVVAGTTFLVPEGFSLWSWLCNSLINIQPPKYLVKTMIVISAFIASWFFTKKRGFSER